MAARFHLPTSRRLITGLALGAATAIVGLSIGLTPLGAYLEEQLGLAWLFEIRGPVEAPEDVAVVAINRDTGGVVGLPEMPRNWPRRIHGTLVENLADAGASAIAFDMDFHVSKSPRDEELLAGAIEAANRVVLFERFEAVRVRTRTSDGQSSLTLAERHQPPIEVLADAAKGIAPWPLPKEDVTIFQYWAFKPKSDDLPTLPSVALQIHALDTYQDWRRYVERTGAPGTENLPERREDIRTASDVRDLMRTLRGIFKGRPEIGDEVLRMAKADNAGNLQLIRALVSLYTGPDNRYLNFYGPPGSIRTLQFHNAVDSGSARFLDLRDKVVFVGFSDLYNPEQPDRFHTVFTGENGIDLSGVEIAATAFANLLTSNSLRTTSPLNTVFILLGCGLVFAMVTYSLPAIMGVPLTLALGAAYWGTAQYAFNTSGTWLPLATPLVFQLPIALFAGLAGQYFLERRQKMRMTKAISYYLPESVAQSLTETGVDPSTLNQVRRGTCLATDMSGFTTLAEGMGPKELAIYMNTYFDSVAEALKQHDVDVTEFHADTIMCAWLSTDTDEATHRRHAALASLAVRTSIDEFNRKTDSHLYARIGLETGPIYIGHTGGGGHFAYSILGDCANTAARLESLNKDLSTHLLTTQDVVDGLDDVLVRRLGYFRVVGKAEPIAVVEILGARERADDAQRTLCERFGTALDLFQARDWQSAALAFKAITAEYPEDGPTFFYLDLCNRYTSDMALPDEPEVIQMTHK